MSNEKKEWLKNIQAPTSPDVGLKEREECHQKIILIVENSIFEKAIFELCKYLGIKVELPQNDWSSRMEEREQNFLKDIKTYINSNDGYTHILCFADANGKNARTQYNALINAIKQACADRSVSLTDSDFQNNEQKGTIISKPQIPTIGFWIMPDNDKKGTFADFYLQNAKINPTLEHRLDDILQKNEEEKLIKYSKNQQTRSFVKYVTLLAWQKEPMQVTQQMYANENFDTGTDLYKNFTKWIKKTLNYEQQ